MHSRAHTHFPPKESLKKGAGGVGGWSSFILPWCVPCVVVTWREMPECSCCSCCYLGFPHTPPPLSTPPSLLQHHSPVSGAWCVASHADRGFTSSNHHIAEGRRRHYRLTAQTLCIHPVGTRATSGGGGGDSGHTTIKNRTEKIQLDP